jgi:hypothetical protein
MRWLLLLALAVSFVLGLHYLLSAWDPREPLNLAAPPNAFTRPKRWWLQLYPEACFAAFEVSAIPIAHVPDRPSDIDCEIQDSEHLPSAIRIAPRDPIVTCPVSAAWTLFDQNTLQPVAKQTFGAGIAEVRHRGSYACRNVNHAIAGRCSQHATANAIDIAGFVLSGGREARIAKDWTGPGPKAVFQHRVRDGACYWFSAVLSADYNAAHHDHFRLDKGIWSHCP